jgi:hypothetical protein
MMTFPIVRTAEENNEECCALSCSPHAVRAKLRWPLSLGIGCRDYLILYACSLHVLLMEPMRLTKQHRNLASAFYERHDFASQPPSSLEQVYDTWKGMSRENSSMDDNIRPDLTRVRANGYYT